MNKTEWSPYLKTVSLLIVSFVSLLFPVFFLTNTTDFFVFPKQLLVVIATIALLVLWAAQALIERRITFRSNPFTVPVMLFGSAVILSAFFSRNMYDSLIQAVPVLFTVFFFFLSINTIDDRKSFNVALTSLTLGAVLSSILSILYYFKVYILPFAGIQSQNLSTLGSPLQQLAYAVPILVLASFYILRKPSKKYFRENSGLGVQFVSSIIILAGMGLVAFEIFKSPQKPLLLPYLHGFQIGLASISQDASRLLTGLLLGSGYGTFSIDFTRFRLASFNGISNMWNLTFSYSSSYVLELLATTGLLGVLAYLFIIVKTVKIRVATLNPLYIALIVTFGLSFIVPFSFAMVFLIFNLLAFYTSYLYLEKDTRVTDMNLLLFASRGEMFSLTQQGYGGHEKTVENRLSLLLPLILAAILLPVVIIAGYFSVNYLRSDMAFAQSLSRDALNNGQKSYDLERNAISTFPYKSDYYVVFSQINYALANSLVNNVPKNSSPSAQTQQVVLGLLQQSINSARAAVTLSPMTSNAWQNLAQVYRNLINVGQNADQFAFASIQQAILLDPNNPQLYIISGGMYYQMQQYQLAANQFATAVQLKPDFANAHYNLGKALEMGGDLNGAMQQYQVVAQLVASNPDSLKKINGEISALQSKIGNQQKQSLNQQQTGQKSTNQPPLELNQQNNAIPNTGKNVKLPPPPAGQPTPTSSKGPGSALPTPNP